MGKTNVLKKQLGRPRRADGLDPKGVEARRLRGRPVVSVSIPSETLAVLDGIARSLPDASRSAAVVAVVAFWLLHHPRKA